MVYVFGLVILSCLILYGSSPCVMLCHFRTLVLISFTCPSFILLCIRSFLFSSSVWLFSLLTCVQLVITPCVFKCLSSPLSLSVWLLCFPHLRPVFLVFPVLFLSVLCFCIFFFYFFSSLTLTDPVCLLCFYFVSCCFGFWTCQLQLTWFIYKPLVPDQPAALPAFGSLNFWPTLTVFPDYT